MLYASCKDTLQDDEIRALALGDTDGDGVQNIVIGSGIVGTVKDYVYSSVNCTGVWQSRFTYSNGGSVEDLEVADLDGDNKSEILLNGIRSRALTPKEPRNVVTLLDGRIFNLKWYDSDLCPPTTVVSSVDLNGDGRLNVVAGSETGRVCAYKDITSKISSILWSFKAAHKVVYLSPIDVEGDGKNEVVVLGNGPDSAILYVLDSDGDKRWSVRIPESLYTASAGDLVASADLDGDEIKDFVVPGGRSFTAYSTVNGKLWEYNLTEDSGRPTIVEALPSGNGGYVVLAAARPNIYAFDGKGNLLFRSEVNTTIYSLSSGDVTGEGVPELVAGGDRFIAVLSLNGTILDVMYMPAQGGQWRSAFEMRWDSVYDLQLNKVLVGDVDSDEVNEVVATYLVTEQRIRNENFRRGTLVVFEPAPQPSIKPPESTSTTLFYILESTSTLTYNPENAPIPVSAKPASSPVTVAEKRTGEAKAVSYLTILSIALVVLALAGVYIMKRK
jgi:hypothetical protein